jgi:hypothetical protein
MLYLRSWFTTLFRRLASSFHKRWRLIYHHKIMNAGVRSRHGHNPGDHWSCVKALDDHSQWLVISARARVYILLASRFHRSQHAWYSRNISMSNSVFEERANHCHRTAPGSVQSCLPCNWVLSYMAYWSGHRSLHICWVPYRITFRNELNLAETILRSDCKLRGGKFDVVLHRNGTASGQILLGIQCSFLHPL